MKRVQPKVLHVINTISRGGAENHLVALIKQQIRLGYQVTVAYLQREGYWRDTLQALGVQVANLGLSFRGYGNPRPAFRLRSLLKNLRPDIVHAHLPPAELYTRLALLGIPAQVLPLVITKHNDDPFCRWRGHRWLARWVAKRADRIIAISEAVRDYMQMMGLGCSPQKIVIIYYGLDPTPYEVAKSAAIQQLRREWSVSDEDFLIGTVARFEPQKALHILLEGFALYLQSAARPAKLAMVGAGSLEADLKRQATHLGIQERVIWAGFRDDIPVVMNVLDVFALTSIWEGFGLVLLEAMAAAKPVIASRVSAVPEVVADQVTGRLVPPRRADLLAEALQFFEDARVRMRFGAAGRKRVEEKFTLARMVEQTVSVYEECLADAGGG